MRAVFIRGYGCFPFPDEATNAQIKIVLDAMLDRLEEGPVPTQEEDCDLRYDVETRRLTAILTPGPGPGLGGIRP